MRWAILAGLLWAVAGCAPAPVVTAEPAPRETTGTATPAPSTAARMTPHPADPPTAEPAPSTVPFRFDVENRSSIGVVVSVASDWGAVMPGFEPGQRGSVRLRLIDPANGVSVEIQGGGCRLLADSYYPTPRVFTLLVDDGPRAGTIRLSTRAGGTARPMPLPENRLHGCGG
jgi:hypothetical protein